MWAGDTRKRILANVAAYNGKVVLVTITGPGDAELPRVGDTGVVDQESAWRWNSTAASRWRRLHRTAAQRARRRHGVLTLVCWTWEYQKRGILHKHLVLGVDTARELAAAHTYVAALDELRESFGFGFVDRGRKHAGKRSLEVIPAEVGARYVAKYLSPRDGAGKPTLSATVLKPDVPPLVVYVSRGMTDRTGITMRYLRRVRVAYFLGHDPETGETFGSMRWREVVRLHEAGVPLHALGP